MSRALFVYAYVPNVPRNPEDGGFLINLFEDDRLTFTHYAADRSVLQEYRFAVPPRLRMGYLACVDTARPWLSQMYQVMRAGEAARYSCRIGIDGYPLFLVEDFEALMNCPFRSARAHYARKMYLLLEDIATELFQAGFTMTPQSFMWDDGRVRPIDAASAGGLFQKNA